MASWQLELCRLNLLRKKKIDPKKREKKPGSESFEAFERCLGPAQAKAQRGGSDEQSCFAFFAGLMSTNSMLKLENQ